MRRFPKRLRTFDRNAQVLLEVLLQAGKLEGVAYTEDLFNLGIAMRRRVEPDRPLQLLDQVGEDRTHGLENLAAVLTGLRRPLKILSFEERQLERLHQRLGAIVTADGDGACPEAVRRGDHQLRVLGADIQKDGGFTAEHAVKVRGVVDRQRGGLHGNRLNGDLLEVKQVLADQLPLHGKDADLDIG